MFVASREKADPGELASSDLGELVSSDLGELASSDPWEETAADQNRRVWNDDCSNILGALRAGG